MITRPAKTPAKTADATIAIKSLGSISFGFGWMPLRGFFMNVDPVLSVTFSRSFQTDKVEARKGLAAQAPLPFNSSVDQGGPVALRCWPVQIHVPGEKSRDWDHDGEEDPVKHVHGSGLHLEGVLRHKMAVC